MKRVRRVALIVHEIYRVTISRYLILDQRNRIYDSDLSSNVLARAVVDGFNANMVAALRGVVKITTPHSATCDLDEQPSCASTLLRRIA